MLYYCVDYFIRVLRIMIVHVDGYSRANYILDSFGNVIYIIRNSAQFALTPNFFLDYFSSLVYDEPISR